MLLLTRRVWPAAVQRESDLGDSGDSQPGGEGSAEMQNPIQESATFESEGDR